MAGKRGRPVEREGGPKLATGCKGEMDARQRSALDHTSSEVILPAAVWAERERIDAWRTEEEACGSAVGVFPEERRTDARRVGGTDAGGS